MPSPPPEDLLDPGFESWVSMSPALAGGFFTTSATWETYFNIIESVYEWIDSSIQI